jgi:hypothetical protein
VVIDRNDRADRTAVLDLEDVSSWFGATLASDSELIAALGAVRELSPQRHRLVDLAAGSQRGAFKFQNEKICNGGRSSRALAAAKARALA